LFTDDLNVSSAPDSVSAEAAAQDAAMQQLFDDLPPDNSPDSDPTFSLVNDWCGESCYPFENATEAMLWLWHTLFPRLPEAKINHLLHPKLKLTDVPATLHAFKKLETLLPAPKPGLFFASPFAR